MAPEIARGGGEFLVTKLFMLQSDAMTILVMAPEMQEEILYQFILMSMSVS